MGYSNDNYLMTLELEEYDECWIQQFALEKKKILNVVGAGVTAVEHIGSTSIPMMLAKPTIDIAIGITSLMLADQYLLRSFEKLGYVYFQELEKHIPERRFLQKLDDLGRHLFHIHILVHEEVLWNNHFKFRNYLIAHPKEAKDYMELKRLLKKEFVNDREQYTLGKAAFVEGLLLKASK